MFHESIPGHQGTIGVEVGLGVPTTGTEAAVALQEAEIMTITEVEEFMIHTTREGIMVWTKDVNSGATGEL